MSVEKYCDQFKIRMTTAIEGEYWLKEDVLDVMESYASAVASKMAREKVEELDKDLDKMSVLDYSLDWIAGFCHAIKEIQNKLK